MQYLRGNIKVHHKDNNKLNKLIQDGKRDTVIWSSCILSESDSSLGGRPSVSLFCSWRRLAARFFFCFRILFNSVSMPCNKLRFKQKRCVCTRLKNPWNAYEYEETLKSPTSCILVKSAARSFSSWYLWRISGLTCDIGCGICIGCGGGTGAGPPFRYLNKGRHKQIEMGMDKLGKESHNKMRILPMTYDCKVSKAIQNPLTLPPASP